MPILVTTFRNQSQPNPFNQIQMLSVDSGAYEKKKVMTMESRECF